MYGAARNLLRESHAGAAAVALLILWAVGSVVDALRQAAAELSPYVATAIAIRRVPFTSASDRLAMLVSAEILAGACIEIALAWLLARWSFGVGPLAALRACGTKLARSKACSNG